MDQEPSNWLVGPRRRGPARPRSRSVGILVLSIAAVLTPVASLQEQNPEAPFFDYRSETPGAVHHITPADLPPPNAAPSDPTFAPMPPAPWPRVPSGFVVEQYAGGLENPRLIRRAPNGDLFVAESQPGRIRVLRGLTPGSPPRVEVFATGLSLPFGIAFYPPGPNPEFVYVANTDSVVRFPYENDDLQARGPQQIVIPQLLPLNTGGHWTRDVAFSLDGRTMYISVGSASNVDGVDNNPAEVNRADILETDPRGGARDVFASGIRNPVSIAVDPLTGELWTAVNERDLLGNNLPPDYITRVLRGGFYGWPWFYIGGNQDPRHPGKHPELKYQAILPDVLLQPHSAPLQLTFYDGDQFPADYQGDIFASTHGSWNRTVLTGYDVIRVRRVNGRATGAYEDFLTGFVSEEGQVRGRPVGVAIAADGSLMVTDDWSNLIWRVRATAARTPDCNVVPDRRRATASADSAKCH
jgi:glucose/arabinose dehydrogenase